MTMYEIIMILAIIIGITLGGVIGFFIGFRRGFKKGRQDEIYHVSAGEMYINPKEVTSGQIRFIFRDTERLFLDNNIDIMYFEVVRMPDGTTFEDFQLDD